MLQNFTASLISKKELAPTIWQLFFKLNEPSSFEFHAGQYMILKIEDKRRLYSILSPNFVTNSFELLVEMIPNGVGSTYLNNLKVGEPSYFQGPAGVFYLKEGKNPKIFLATGTGIAPIYSQIYSFLSSNNNKTENNLNSAPELILFWGLRSAQNVYLKDELQKLADQYTNFKFYICLSRETDESIFERTCFKKGRINTVLTNRFDDQSGLSNEYEYYICGGREIVATTQEFLLANNIEKRNIIAEKF